MYFCNYAKSKEKVLFYPYSSLFLEYKLKIQSIGVSNGLCCIFYLTVSSHLKAYYMRALSNVFNSEDTRTWKSVFVKCKRARSLVVSPSCRY